MWTWVAIDAETKLVPSWRIGDRSAETAISFADDLASRLIGRAQITSDGHKAYLVAIEGAFGGDVDYAMLIKSYSSALTNAFSKKIENHALSVALHYALQLLPNSSFA